MDLATAIILLIYLLFLFPIIVVLFPLIRRKLKLRWKEPNFYEDNLHYLVMARQILLFCTPLAIATLMLWNVPDAGTVTAMLVFGLSINVFWIVQWPLLTKAQILVTFETTVIDEKAGNKKPMAFGNEQFSEEISFEPEKMTLVRTAVYNLGFSTLKNSAIEIYFGSNFRVLPIQETPYNKLDFCKSFTVQMKHSAVVFSPKDNFQSIPPQEVFIFPVIVETPREAPDGCVTVQFFSENSWGMRKVKAKFKIPFNEHIKADEATLRANANEKKDENNRKLTKKKLLSIFIVMALVTSGIYGAFWWADSSFHEGHNIGQTDVWDMISNTEKNLRDLYSNSTQIELKVWLPNNPMNFTDGLIWESKLLNFTLDRPKFENVTQVLKNGKAACGEFALVYGAFCVVNDIPFRFISVGYFVPGVVDHNWIQVNPSHDGETWIHIDVSDTCDNLKKGKTLDDLWNITINNNAQYRNMDYKMVLAYEMNQNGEIVITDVTATFS